MITIRANSTRNIRANKNTGSEKICVGAAWEVSGKRMAQNKTDTIMLPKALILDFIFVLYGIILNAFMINIPFVSTKVTACVTKEKPVDTDFDQQA